MTTTGITILILGLIGGVVTTEDNCWYHRLLLVIGGVMLGAALVFLADRQGGQ